LPFDTICTIILLYIQNIRLRSNTETQVNEKRKNRIINVVIVSRFDLKNFVLLRVRFRKFAKFFGICNPIFTLMQSLFSHCDVKIVLYNAIFLFVAFIQS